MPKTKKCRTCGRMIYEKETQCIDCRYNDLVGKQLADADTVPLEDVQLLVIKTDGTGAYVEKCLGGAEEITVPAEYGGRRVYRIAKEAFAHDDDIRRVILPDTVEIIEEKAFADSELEQITLPDGLREIGRDAFNNSSLKHAVLPDSLKSIGDGAFRETELVGVVIPEGVDIIPRNAFRGSKLESAVILGAKRIQNSAFGECDRLCRVYLGDGLQTIDDEAFSGAKIRRLIIPDSVTKIGSENLNKDMQLAVTGLTTSIELRPEDVKEFDATLFAKQTSRAWAQATAAGVSRRPLCEFKI